MEDEWWHNIIIASDDPKHPDVDWVFAFYQYECESVLRLTPKHSEFFVLTLPGECPAVDHTVSKFLEE